MTRTTSILGALVLLGLAAGPGFAADTVTVSADNSTKVNIPGYSGIIETGAGLAGSTATVTYVGGASTVYTYHTTGSQSGAASGNGFFLGASGPDTFHGDSTPWTLSNTGVGITDIKLDLFPGNSAFDRTQPSPGTPGSGIGQDFNVLSDTGTRSIAATYSGEVVLPPNAPQGDAYEFLDLNFGTATPFAASTLTFNADTDSLSTPVTPPGVPEPAPLTIVGVGALMMAGLIARKRRSLKA